MLLPSPQDPLFQEIETLVINHKMALLDFHVRKKDGIVKVGVVLWKDGGVGIDECSKIHRQLLPRFEIHFETENVFVEVSSPGLERNLKYDKELAIFKGKKIKILLQGASEWIQGVLDQVNDQVVVLKSDDKQIEIEKNKISKAKLNDI